MKKSVRLITELNKSLVFLMETYGKHCGLCCDFIHGKIVVTEYSCVCDENLKQARKAMAEASEFLKEHDEV